MSDPAMMRQQLRADLEAIDRLSEEAKAAEREELRARIALDDAAAAYSRVHLRVQDLHFRRSSLCQSVDATMRALNTLATFPAELLSHIFVYATGPSAGDDWRTVVDAEGPSCCIVDTSRAAIPWRLGAVCNHWRAVMLSTAAAWSYIGIAFAVEDDATAMNSRSKARALAAAERSRCALLDVVLESPDSLDSMDPDFNDEAQDLLEREHLFFDGIFEFLHVAMTRVRSLRASVRHRVPQAIATPWFSPTREKLLSLLRTPAEHLVDLRVSLLMSGGEDSLPENKYWHSFPATPMPLFLPVAPKLQYLELRHIPVVCRQPHPGLPSLERISLARPHMYVTHLHEMLSLAPSLQHVRLNVRTALHLAAASTVSPLPARTVTTLHLSAGESFNVLEDGARLFPNLSELHIANLADLSISESLAQRLTTLRLWGRLNVHDDVETLRQLKSIEHAAFRGGTMHDDLFFEPFCATEDPMWPQLKTLEFTCVNLLSVECDGLLRLVRARNSGRTQETPASSPPCPLEHVSFDALSIPAWVAVQIRAILPIRDPLPG
ncbi:hypothetical protein AURDEDRAFT_183251 [Auricularia subglabra TFB-10046 SS5]|nr:hypothetical protein AURDEDRAFT_183251 [Auricularia subglabra TFB-10046 SS5]